MVGVSLLQGNRLFKEAKYELAKLKYERVSSLPDLNCRDCPAQSDH